MRKSLSAHSRIIFLFTKETQTAATKNENPALYPEASKRGSSILHLRRQKKSHHPRLENYASFVLGMWCLQFYMFSSKENYGKMDSDFGQFDPPTELKVWTSYQEP